MRTVAALVAVLLLSAGAWSPRAEDAQPTVRIGVLKDGSYDVVTLPLEEYVARVLTGEALPGSPPAAMEALAIAVRTYTQANLGRHKAQGFDLCDQTDCQVMRTATPVTTRAAEATAGQVLLYRGQPATIYYSASCGGRTEVPSAVWPGRDDPPYLPSQPDDGCGGGPVWTAELALTDLRRAFGTAGYTGVLREMRIQSRDQSGRVAKLTLDGLTPSEVSGQDLRSVIGRTLGWQYVRSAAFDMRRSGDTYRMDGRGSGHGVGMCVIGSSKLAEAGRSTNTILTHYFPGVDIGGFVQRTIAAASAVPVMSAPAAAVAPSALTLPVPLPPAPALTPAPRVPSTPGSFGTAARSPAPRDLPAAAPTAAPVAPVALVALSRPAASPAPAPAIVDGVAVSVPTADEGDRAALTAIARRERDALAKTLGVSAPSRLTVHVHATFEEYQQATGRPWFTSGAVVNGEIHLVPIAPLRDRGVLELTVREQVVHLLVDNALGQRPAWVREGAAQYFSQSASATSEFLVRTPCPTDAELEQPISAGALSNAFAEARACFERQVTSGRSWRDVK